MRQGRASASRLQQLKIWPEPEGSPPFPVMIPETEQPHCRRNCLCVGRAATTGNFMIIGRDLELGVRRIRDGLLDALDPWASPAGTPPTIRSSIAKAMRSATPSPSGRTSAHMSWPPTRGFSSTSHRKLLLGRRPSRRQSGQCSGSRKARNLDHKSDYRLQKPQALDTVGQSGRHPHHVGRGPGPEQCDRPRAQHR